MSQLFSEFKQLGLQDSLLAESMYYIALISYENSITPNQRALGEACYYFGFIKGSGLD